MLEETNDIRHQTKKHVENSSHYKINRHKKQAASQHSCSVSVQPSSQRQLYNRTAHKIQTSKSTDWTRRPMQRLTNILKFALSRSDQLDATQYQIWYECSIALISLGRLIALWHLDDVSCSALSKWITYFWQHLLRDIKYSRSSSIWDSGKGMMLGPSLPPFGFNATQLKWLNKRLDSHDFEGSVLGCWNNYRYEHTTELDVQFHILEVCRLGDYFYTCSSFHRW